MGNEQKQPGRLDPHLDLHSEVEHPIHGSTRIYCSKSLPMTFLMRLERITTHSRLYNLFQQIQDKESPYLLTLYGFKLQREEGCSTCSPGDKTIQYWEYLNYTLQDHITDRAQRKVTFTYHQIWHVLQVVISAIRTTQQMGLIWDLHPSLLEVTPEGKLKANWSNLQLDNRHLRFFRGREEEGWWSPEERWAMKHREKIVNFEQANVYKVGLLVLAMANLTTEPVLNALTWKEVLKYSQHPIPAIIDRCLDPQPRNRVTIDQLQELCQEYFNSAYELLISEGRREDLQELQVRAQMLAQQNRTDLHFSELREGSRYYESVPFQFSYYRQSRVDHSQDAYDQRLQALKEYRRSMAMSRNNQK